MKWFMLIFIFGNLVSCNTAIGLWRDTEIGYNWTKEKIQNSQGGGQSYDEGAPVY